MAEMLPDWSIDERNPAPDECARCGREGRIGFDLEVAPNNHRPYCARCGDERERERIQRLSKGCRVGPRDVRRG